MEKKYQRTLYACFLGYIVQAIVNNFAPLLFLTFQRTYGIPLSKITLLITFNFAIQLLVDLVAAGFVDKIGYRVSMVAAHIFAVLGLVLMTILPEIFNDAFIGLLISVMLYAIGGGLLEVLVSPIVEALPSEHKEKTMSLLHSFYCWGHVGVVLISTLFFATVGISKWKILACFWAILPLINVFAFMRVPICHLVEEGKTGLSLKELIKMPIFWLFILLMICSGASEQAVSQWTSTFAETALGVSKTVGDLSGVLIFATLMGTARMLYGKYGDRINLKKAIIASGILCVFSYLMISIPDITIINLLGCGICGFSVGIFWPGTFSIASATIKRGGTVMFAFLALAGDVGCSAGPTLVGFVSELFNGDLKRGIMVAVICPVILLLGMTLVRKSEN